MRRFELPVLAAGDTVADALAAAIDANKSGVVARDARGQLRIIRFATLASANKDSPLSDLDGETARRLAPPPALRPPAARPIVAAPGVRALRDSGEAGAVERAFAALGHSFAVLGVTGGIAELMSDHETSAETLERASSGYRCQRPQTNPPSPPRKYFHYYPPNVPDAATPDACIVCGSPLP